MPLARTHQAGLVAGNREGNMAEYALPVLGWLRNGLLNYGTTRTVWQTR